MHKRPQLIIGERRMSTPPVHTALMCASITLAALSSFPATAELPMHRRVVQLSPTRVESSLANGGEHGGLQPVVGLRYSTAVRIDPGNFPNLMLMQTCLDGTGTATQSGLSVACRRGETVPLSPGLDMLLDFDARFAEKSVRVSIPRLEMLCSRWLNEPLEHPLRFELRPFSPDLERAWVQAVTLLLTYERMNIVLPQAAATSFDEFMLSLLLAQHPHNYSVELERTSDSATPRIVREAEHFMRIGGTQITVSGVAAQLGVSLRTLEAGFRKWRQSTPTQFLRRLRLEAARAELLVPSESTTVTSVALANGFFHLARFSAYYGAAYGEAPGHTLRRSKRKSAHP